MNMTDQCALQSAGGNSDILNLQSVLEEEIRQKKRLEEEVIVLRSQFSQLTMEAGQVQSLTCL